ncbi:MAG: DUF3549 family protein [gamma proteobacterium symbiont of Taylorina sp.]|nr:DUF3549 family protein [gamma proteobacterium symbiont of Taylorina sp.]
MKDLNNIAQFFSEINSHLQCYEMGRLIRPIEKKQWLDFEENITPWPSPFLQHAWIGLTFFEKEMTEHKNPTVWFLKLPLDEQSRLNLSARNDFLHRLFETLGFFLQQHRLGKNNAANKSAASSLENAMNDNPYGFQPKQEEMANFHAIVRKHLGLNASSYYQQTQIYLANIGQSEQREQWEQLCIQGFADISARLDEKYQGKNNQQLLIDSIEQLPIPAFRILSLCLENHPVSKKMIQTISSRVEKEIRRNINNDPSLASICIASIRATAQSCDKELQTQLLMRILNSSVKTDIEILASISARCWQQLTDKKLLSLYLETLAITNEEQHHGAFNAILSDLMFIPGARDNILQAFRSAKRSKLLEQAIADFFKRFYRKDG